MINHIRLTNTGGDALYISINAQMVMQFSGNTTTVWLFGSCWTVVETPEQIDRMISEAQADLAILGQCSKKEIDAVQALVNIKKTLDEILK